MQAASTKTAIVVTRLTGISCVTGIYLNRQSITRIDSDNVLDSPFVIKRYMCMNFKIYMILIKLMTDLSHCQ